MKIHTVINFCTLDMRFLVRCVEAVRPFSSVSLSACTHLFDGTPEDKRLLEAASRVADLILFPFDPLPVDSPFQPGDGEWPHFLHSVGRYMGAVAAQDADYFLFLDADEIVDTERFQSLLPEMLTFDAVRLSSYFYFRSARFRAVSYQQNALLLKQGALPCLESLLTPLERFGAFQAAGGRKWENNTPLVHHFSWVKSDDELRKKVRCWGHREERPWVELLEEELKHPFQGRESLFELTYEEIDPIWDPLESRLHYLGKQELKELELARLLQQS